MLILQVLGIAVALSIDAMVVALCWSATCKHVTTKHIFQFAAAFGFFQFLMPLAGGLAGNTVADLVSSWDHWIAFALLAWVSLSMVREAFGDEEEPELWDEGTKNGPDRSALLGHNFVCQETKPHGFYSSYFHQRTSS